MRLLTLSERKGSASFGAGPLFVDGGYCGDVCSIGYQVVQSCFGVAPLGTEWCNLAALLLCLVRSGTISLRCCSARYQVVQSCCVAAPLGTQQCFIYSIIVIGFTVSLEYHPITSQCPDLSEPMRRMRLRFWRVLMARAMVGRERRHWVASCS